MSAACQPRCATPTDPLTSLKVSRLRPGLVGGSSSTRVERDALVGQERGVGGEDAVLGAQRDQLVDQLLVLAVQVDLVDDEADPPDGPELLDEVVRRVPRPARPARRGTRTVRRSPPTLPEIRNGRPARLAIAAGQDELAALEEVGEVAGIGPVDVGAGELDPDRRRARGWSSCE